MEAGLSPDSAFDFAHRDPAVGSPPHEVFLQLGFMSWPVFRTARIVESGWPIDAEMAGRGRASRDDSPDDVRRRPGAARREAFA